MKKVLLIALVACSSVQAEQVASSNSVNFYAGASVAGSWTSSDFNMDYEPVDNLKDIVKPYANHKESSIGRVGAGFHAGIKKKFKNNWFIAGEFGYTLSRAKHHHDFTYFEDQEDDIGTVDVDKRSQTVSKTNIKHGDELSLALKFGKDCNSFDVYGILGVTTRNVEIGYSVEADTDWTSRDTDFDVSKKERAWGAVFGLGGSKKITDRISCSLEYKYKLYNSAKKDVDCRAESRKAFSPTSGNPHDISDRHFKVKSDKHEISLGITFNI